MPLTPTAIKDKAGELGGRGFREVCVCVRPTSEARVFQWCKYRSIFKLFAVSICDVCPGGC